MPLRGLKRVAERNIRKLFLAFHQNPAVFLSEADVMCYLYALLLNDPFIARAMPFLKSKNLKKQSRTTLVHSELRAGKNPEDIVIMKRTKTIDLHSFYTSIGIEIKFNRKRPARKEKSNIISDIRKLKGEFFGYLLWLNWDREIGEDQLKRVQKAVSKHTNIKFYFMDMFSKPTRTNVKLPRSSQTRDLRD